MSLPSGTRIGTFEVVEKLGEGGMGEVYRVRDMRLKRDVAIKVLPSEVAGDAERLARFQREAEVLASLNHPHIAQIYGLENPPDHLRQGYGGQEGGHYIVMELVEGEDLSQRIARGPIPIDEALPIAKQIAEALETAHDAGIIHRDLKPANIKVRADGTVKVLDFGLAKALDQGSAIGEHGSAALANSPTITSPAMTQRGVILGTAAYMSPEQAKGKVVDRRTDIWAFGCVLFEMLTGKRTFAGDDVSDTLVSILRDDPRWTDLPSNVPAHVRQLLRRCLQKDPQKRLPHIGAARLDLADADTGELIRASEPQSNRWPIPAAIGAAAGAAAVAVVAMVAIPADRPEAGRPPVRFTIASPEGTIFPGAGGVPRFALSPDGRRIAYQLQDAKSVKLFVRSLAAIDAEPVAGENDIDGMAGGVPGGNTQQPFWSPDSQTVGFFDALTGQMKKRDLRTQLTDVITAVQGIQMSATWAGDAILFSSLRTAGIRHVRPDGEGSRQITTVDASKQEAAHLWPEFLADGRHFTYLVTFVDDTPPVLYVASMDGTPPKKVFDSPAGARFAWPDRLLFVRNEALVSQRFDLNTLSTVGQPEVVTNSILFTSAGRIGVSSASQAPVIAYAAGPGLVAGEGFETRWLDRSGTTINGSPSSVVVGINGLRLAAGGRTLLYTRGLTRSRGESTTSLWAQDTQRGIETLLTDGSAPGAHPAVSPDGSRIVYREFAGGRISLMLMPLSGTTVAERLFTGEDRTGIVPFEWSPRDEILFFLDSSAADDAGLWLLPVAGDRRPRRYLGGEYRMGASLSPDGQWIAYAAGTTAATSQVFVQSFSDPMLGKWPVSPIGGTFPRWRGDGHELFYLDNRRQLMAVSIATSPRVEIGKPVALFADIGTDRQTVIAYPYDVMPDGKRFVVMRPRTSSEQIATLIIDIK